MTKEEQAEFLKQYRLDHCVCPVCHKSNYSTTLAGYILYNKEDYKDKNRCTCHNCGWVGIRHEMLPMSEKIIEIPL